MAIKRKHKKGNPGRGGAQPGAGRPSEKTEEEIQKAEEYAKVGAQNGTIEGLMDWADGTIDQNKEISRRLTKKRQEHKIDILKNQQKRGDEGSDTMLIWQGKQHLGQSDKNTQTHDMSENLADFLKGMH